MFKNFFKKIKEGKFNPSTLRITNVSSTPKATSLLPEKIEILKKVQQDLENDIQTFIEERKEKLKMMEKTKQEFAEVVEKLKGEKRKLEIALTSEMNEKWKKLKQEQEKVNGLYVDNSTIIGINVGGKKYQTTAGTLRTRVPYSLKEKEVTTTHFLASLCLKNNKLLKEKDGNYFIDRDGVLFKYILNYIRAKGIIKEITLPSDDTERSELAIEAEFYGLNHLSDYLNKDFQISTKSEILRPRDFILFHKEMKELGVKKFVRIFNSKIDGGNAWPEKVFNKGPTLVVLQSTSGNIFGGYSSQSWMGTNQYRSLPNTFIFSLKNEEGYQFYKFPQKSTASTYSVYDGLTYMSFGGGYDFNWYFNNTTQSYSNFGHTYDTLGKHKNFLAGTYNFRASVVEVFSVNLIKKKKKK